MSDNLNLARKWRSKKFNEIVGQEIIIRLLKNSLYKDLIFPAYLLSGPRGSGKTSVGRIFAGALNCSSIDDFKKRPKEFDLPCLNCKSCQLMINLSHPDFIEIDAASNTGVENIRNIIENVSFMPILGRKKIYLIDEVHMLSKSAFNAFLKILEEPPKTVVFLLATTDINKVLETVQSRCFNLYFSSIKLEDIVMQLRYIAERENILFEIHALELIAQESGGSLRDAINLFERARLNDNIDSKLVSKNLVLELLGYIKDQELLNILKIIFTGDFKKYINYINSIELKKYNSYIVWKQFVSLLHNLILIKNNIVNNTYNLNSEFLDKLDIKLLISFLDFCYNSEFTLVKTSYSYIYLELIFIKLFYQFNNKILNNEKINIKDCNIKDDISNDSFIIENDIINNNDKDNDIKFKKFLSEISTLKDPLLDSIFGQAKVNYCENYIEFIFNKDFVFFNDIIQETKIHWQPLFNKVYGTNISFDFKFNDKNIDNKINTESNFSNNFIKNNNSVNNFNQEKLDFSDKAKWPKVNAILKIFPGKIKN